MTIDYQPLPGLRLSVVIATTKPWPEVRRCLDSLHAQARDDFEILVADGDGHGLPDNTAQLYPEVVWLRENGASVFRLRGLAMASARGAVIAVTEDHCEVAPDWCARVVEAHKNYPDAAAIGGVVENGATTRLIDWANFFLVFGPFTAPIENGEQSRISLQANISYKARVVPRVVPPLGMMEMLFNRELIARGEKLVADDSLVVHHIQSWGFFGTFAAHFHNGRSIAGFRLRDIGWPERALRLLGAFILPPVLYWRTLAPIAAKRRLALPALMSSPLLALLVICHSAGEFVGYVAGAGKSPQQLA